ncbi:hypothetical protein C8R47DRAFT_1135859 [Mycena vitilis]|nr:hypothetical protein C8R47DRAFT_1135859 [Mycena vitilis]
MLKFRSLVMSILQSCHPVGVAWQVARTDQGLAAVALGGLDFGGHLDNGQPEHLDCKRTPISRKEYMLNWVGLRLVNSSSY